MLFSLLGTGKLNVSIFLLSYVLPGFQKGKTWRKDERHWILYGSSILRTWNEVYLRVTETLAP